MRLDGARFASDDADADQGDDAAGHHVDDVLGLAGAAVDGVGDLGSGFGGRAGDRVAAVEALNEQEDAEGDEDDADDVFHGGVMCWGTTDRRWRGAFRDEKARAGAKSASGGVSVCLRGGGVECRRVAWRSAAQLLNALAQAGKIGIEAKRFFEARDGVGAAFFEEKGEAEFGVEAGVVGELCEGAFVVDDGFGEATAAGERGGPGALDEGIFGREREGFFQVGLRGGGLVELFQGASESEMGDAGIWIGGEGVAEVRGGVGGFASAEKCETDLDLHGGEIGAELGGTTQVGEGVVGAAEFGEGKRETEVGVGIVGDGGEHGFEVDDRGGGEAVAEVGEALAEERFAVGRLLSDGGGEVRGGFVATMQFEESEAEAKTRERIARTKLEDALEAGDGGGNLVAAILDGGEGEEGGGIVGIERERAAGFGLRFLDTTVAEKRVGEEAVRGVAVGADLGGVAEERDGVAPDELLIPRADDAGDEDEAGGEAGEDADGGGERKMGERAEERELEAEERKVGVAIGHRLHADLEDADGGQKRDEKPKPAGEQGGAAGALAPREEAEDDEHGDGGENDEERPGAGVRVEDGEVGGPEEFSDVANVGDGGVGEPGAEREREGERAEVRLHQDCHYRDDGGEGEERDLLEDERTPAGGERAEAGASGGRGGEALQRPEVEEQENEGQRDDHWLAHQAEEEKREGERVEAERA